MLSVKLVTAESHSLPQMRVEEHFQLQHKSLCLQSTAEVLLIKEHSTSCLVPEFEGTVGELVEALVDFVFPSDSGVTYPSHPRLLTSRETGFSIWND